MLNRDISRTVYRLKRTRGVLAVLSKPEKNTVDLDTGAMSRTFIKHEIKRVILLNHSEAHKLMIARLTQGQYDIHDRVAVIDGKDVDFEITPEYILSVEETRYRIVSIEKTVGYLTYWIKLCAVDSQEDIP